MPRVALGYGCSLRNEVMWTILSPATSIIDLVGSLLNSFVNCSSLFPSASPSHDTELPGGIVNPLYVIKLNRLPVICWVLSSAPVITTLATLFASGEVPVSSNESFSVSIRSTTLCMRDEWSPHQIGVANMMISAAIIFLSIFGQSSPLPIFSLIPGLIS